MEVSKVLFVDDEINVLNSIKRSIINEDIEPILVADGEKAIKIIMKNKIKVLVTDMRMPQMNGLELLKTAKEISPDTVRIVLSGYTQLSQILATINNGDIFRFLVKPWDNEKELIPAVKDAINFYDLKQQSKIFSKQLEIKNNMYKNALEANKELIFNINKDMQNLKLIHSFSIKIDKVLIMALENKQLSLKEVEKYKEYITSIYNDYLNTIPTKVESFNLSKLKEDINEYMEIENFYVDNEDFKHIGNYKVILCTVKSILNLLSVQMEKKIIGISINSYPTITISIDINKTIDNSIFFTLVKNLVKQFLVTIEGDIVIDNDRSRIIINGNTRI